ncbi:uncharacterized protein LOC142229592 [Haematobia irritans]|uniref:uncharacterized protein LOC142229592 n=1 Tax=Haematobia irritans TaxID=7368 RepID=UPI003F4FBD58
MDLFDQLKTSGPVEKGFKKGKKEEKRTPDSKNKSHTDKERRKSIDKHRSLEDNGKKKNGQEDNLLKKKSSSIEKENSKKKKDHHHQEKKSSKNLEASTKQNPANKDKYANSSPSKHKSNDVATKRKDDHDRKLAQFNAVHKSHDKKNKRRESLPISLETKLNKKKVDKSRSLSPPKNTPPTKVKPVKVKVERKTLDQVNSKSSNTSLNKEVKKTPTKAQQKLFENPMGIKKSKDSISRKHAIKRCVVRIRRDNLEKLMREFRKNKSQTKLSKLVLGKRSAASSPTFKNDGSPPLKKGKTGSVSKPQKSSFFIKLATPKLDKSKTEKKDKKSSSTKYIHSSSSSSSSVAQHNKIKNSKSSVNTTPTKFSKSQLISTFGERWFKSRVRIEKCKHTLAMIFESNARARRAQNKHKKSKNLSVSFRDQVEVFGDTTDSDDSYDENFCAIPNANSSTSSTRNGRRGSGLATTPAVAAPAIVMPARLKKVENGRVVDDIVLDPSLFLGSQSLVASTPYSPGRKKRDHKSFSPLKDEGTPSPRKEQLKLANERVPPTGLRRLNIEDEDDDEDDDCEYIVPIELPQRRASRTSSTNTIEAGPAIIPPTFDDAAETPYNSSAIFNKIDEVINIAKAIVSPVTVSSTNTAEGAIPTNNGDGNDNSDIESHDSFQSANSHVKKNSPDAALDDGNASTLNGNAEKTMNNASVNLFLEDSQTNEDSREKNYVDSIINETIDKLGRDIGSSNSPLSNETLKN